MTAAELATIRAALNAQVFGAGMFSDEHGQGLARAAIRDGRLVMVAGRLRLAGPPVPTTAKRPDLALLRPSRLPTARLPPTPRMRLRAVDDGPRPEPPRPALSEPPKPGAEPPRVDTEPGPDTSPEPPTAPIPTPEPAVSTPPKPRRPLGGRHNPITDAEILRGLARHPDGAGPRALADTLERCHTSLRLPLRRLVDAGKVVRTGGLNGPTVRYHLATGAPKAGAVREVAAPARSTGRAPAPASPPSSATLASIWASSSATRSPSERARAADAPRRVAPSTPAPTTPTERPIRQHVLADRRDQLVSELELARLRVLEVEGQLAAIADELARVSA